jgi:hypothetical protein
LILIDSIGNHEMREHNTPGDIRRQAVSRFKTKISRELASEDLPVCPFLRQNRKRLSRTR